MRGWSRGCIIAAMGDASAEESQDVVPSGAVVANLVANHRDFLAFIERKVESRALAEDILQDAFVKGMAKLDTLREGESAVAWFYRMLRNAVIDHYRKRGAASRGLEAFAKELDQHVEPEAAVKNAVCQCVGRLAQTLKPEYADAIQRIEVDGVTVKAFAVEAGISSNNAAVRVFRAREALRKQVALSCGTCAEHGCLDCTCDSGS